MFSSITSLDLVGKRPLFLYDNKISDLMDFRYAGQPSVTSDLEGLMKRLTLWLVDYSSLLAAIRY